MLYVLLLLFVGLLIATAAIRVKRTTASRYELKRLSKAGDLAAQQTLLRESLIPDIVSLQRAIIALAIIGCTLVSVAAFGWVVGIVVSFVISLGYGIVSRRDTINNLVQNRYEGYEPRIINGIQKAPFLFSLLRTVALEPAPDPVLQSKEQLLHLIDQSRDVLPSRQKVRMRHGLSFSDKRVADIMTPRSMIRSIAVSEVLGPLVLDDLHKTGHSRFPVVDGDIDHVVGVLHIRNLLTLDSGKATTTTVQKAMESRVFYIKDTQTLEHALSAFLKTHHHLFVVVNEFRETVGVISLEDVIETLLGEKIVDEFDTHEDLRAVAARNPRANNTSKKQVDI